MLQSTRFCCLQGKRLPLRRGPKPFQKPILATLSCQLTTLQHMLRS